MRHSVARKCVHLNCQLMFILGKKTALRIEGGQKLFTAKRPRAIQAAHPIVRNMEALVAGPMDEEPQRLTGALQVAWLT